MKYSIFIILATLFFAQSVRAQKPDQQAHVLKIDIPQATQGQQGWVRLNFNAGQLAYGLTLLNKDTAWVATYDSQYVTLDAGQTWRSWPGAPVGTVSFAGPLIGIIVGPDANPLHVYHTFDGGKRWDTIAIANMDAYEGLARVGHDTIFICGSSSVARSLDGGVTWNAGTFGVGLTAIGFCNSKDGYAVGGLARWIGPPQQPDAAEVWVTTDGGVNWRPQYSGIPRGLHAVHPIDPKHVVVAGYDGYIAYTQDGGNVIVGGHWNSVPSGTTTESFGSIASPSSANATLVGSAGRIMHTIDSGKSWTRQISGVSTALGAVAFADDSNGFAGGEQNVILHTSDGGMDWVQISPPAANPLIISAFPQPSNAIVQMSYSLPQVQNVTATIHDITGRLISTLAKHELQQPGNHMLTFDGSQLPAGVYTYQIQTERYQATGKLTLVK